MNTPTRGETATPEQAPLLTVEAPPAPPRVPPRGASPTKVFRAWSPEQAALLPAAKRDHLGEGHLAVFLLDLLPTLSLQPILDAYPEDRGQPPYDPRMMTVLLLYAYSQGITSSRQIERRCREDLGFMYLTADACPDHDTICAFRRAHLAAFQGLFLETLRIAQEAGVLQVGRMALDGTKIEANASKHKAMSYARMPDRQVALEAEIRRLLEEAEALDRAEDQQYGRGRRGDELPAALQDPATRRQRLREAKARLEAERKRELAAQKQVQVAQIEQAKQALEAEAREQARAAGQPHPDAARPAPKAQRNFTDPDSRIMKTADGFQQCYNAQVAVTVDTQLIVAADVVQAANDKQQLHPLVAQVLANVGAPDGVIADSGYFSEANVQALEQRPRDPIEAHIAVERQRHGAPPTGPPRGLLVVSPYLVPGDGGMKMLENLRNRKVHVRIITNSLASTDMPIVHSGYQKYRGPMLKDGIELYEVRPVLGNPDAKGGGGSLRNPSGGQFALHAKVFVLDRRWVFVGSMNFDRRSLRLNTELGMLIDSPELARQVIARFNAIAQPANSYVPTLTAADASGRQSLIWRTEEGGKVVELTSEPMGDLMKGVKTELLTLLPLDDLL